MQLFYNPELTPDMSQIVFSKEESQHMVKVLRKKVGDAVQITNGQGWMFQAEITKADTKNCIADIQSKTFQQPREYKIHIAIAPTKMNDRFEWFLEKATEIGVDVITPIICDHSERKVVKMDRFEKILQSAMKQSLHYYLPKLQAPCAFEEFLASNFEGQKFIAHCEDTERKSLKVALVSRKNVLVLIGPEGDFSTKEISSALNTGFQPVTLGNTRLRTETAGVVACHSIIYAND